MSITDNTSEYGSLNGNIISIREIQIPISTPTVYEVIRIMEGVPLFFESHYERLKNSLQLSGYKLIWSPELLKSYILSLVQFEKIQNHNVKIQVFQEGSQSMMFIYFNRTSYPPSSLYKEGVKLGLLNAERGQPNIKQTNSLNELLQQRKNIFFEHLLINKLGKITEGSRSNVFFIQDNSIFTAPDNEVLKGVTRNTVIECCQSLGLPIVFDSIDASLIHEYESCFLTGTSLKVLPVAQVEEIVFPTVSNEIYTSISREFNARVSSYVSSNNFNYE
ncbi:branched-chain amino acid aminotransferase [Paenibacillus sp. JGP012]|uniref:aminotransferase class IV n=1 Tax=Paenibacillus sp. JGP012 TaxID=2735914 RepID=UPI00161A5C1C|nr:aminotransferase class IV [Paenibacillus sp. JGP012]MBB6022765.1 branched-chain amino acid aminotransferase [Paenibacillus sp. JGP012]